MRICIISDVHGELDNVKLLIDKLRRENIDMVIYLGDDYGDVDLIEREGFKLIRVPGVYEEIYKKPEIPNRRIENIEGWRILLTHTETKHQNDLPADPDPQELLSKGEIDILLHGHTHIPKVEVRGRQLIVNPGHLKKSDKKGYPATYAIMDITSESIRIEIKELFTDRKLIELVLSKF